MAEMSYFLAVDVGTSRIAAATARVAADGSIVTAPFALGRRSDSVATVVFVGDDGELSFGDAAERRGVTQPDRLIREFKRSVGDEVPLVVGGRSLPAEQLYAQTVASIVALVTEREGRRPEAVSLTHPTAWGGHRIDLIRSALARVGVAEVELITEPEAAARHYEASRSLEPGQTLAVYDLGGGTFDCVILRKEIDGSFGLVGEPVGIENLGGADFDDAVMRHVVASAGLDVTTLDLDDPAVRMSLSQLRRECVDAKEALSFDSEATVPVVVPPTHTSVRLTRSEFEDMISGSLDRTLDTLEDALDSASLQPEALESILLIGGSSRIPFVTQRLSERFDRPIAIDADPKAAIALGAARTALIRLTDRQLAFGAGAALALAANPAAATELTILDGASETELLLTASRTTDAAPAPVQPATKAHTTSPFVLGGAAIMIAGAIVFASTLSAGSGGGMLTSEIGTPSPTAATEEPPAAPAPAPAAAAPAPRTESAPVARTDSAPKQRSGASPNPRRSATPTAPKKSTAAAKPTTPPKASTPAARPTARPTTPPAESNDTAAEPTSPTTAPSEPTQAPAEPTQPTTAPAPDPTAEPTNPPAEEVPPPPAEETPPPPAEEPPPPAEEPPPPAEEVPPPAEEPPAPQPTDSPDPV